MRILLTCLLILFFVGIGPAAGEEAEPSPLQVLQQLGWQPAVAQDPFRPDASSAASGGQGPLVQLTLMDAIRYSLEGNQDIEVVSYTPWQSAEAVESAESAFDASVFADTSFSREPNLQSSVSDIVMEDTGLFQTGIRKPLSTGGSLSTFLEMRYDDLINAQIDRTYRYIFAPTVEVRQPILKNFGGREEKAAIKIANHRANISDEALRLKTIEVVTRVSNVYWQLFLFRKLVEINRENLDMAEEVHRREAVRLSQGISQQIDVERAKSNVQARRSTLLQSRQRLQAATDQLKLLLNSPGLSIDSTTDIVPVETPQTVPLEVDEAQIIETALNHRPEMKSAIQKLRIRQVEEDLTAHQQLPNLDVFGRYSLSGYGREFGDAVSDTGLNDEDAWAVGLNFEWPIGNRSAKSSHRKKRLERRQAIAQVKQIGNQIKLDVKQVLLAIYYAEGEIESARLAKEAAENVVAGEFARFDIGRKTNEELLRAQDLLAASSRNFMRAVVDYNIALADLARVQGNLPAGIVIGDIRQRPK
jgi:outer membrane protein TolC